MQLLLFLKMNIFLWLFFEGLARFTWRKRDFFAYVTDKIVPGVFLFRLAGINFWIEEEQ